MYIKTTNTGRRKPYMWRLYTEVNNIAQHQIQNWMKMDISAKRRFWRWKALVAKNAPFELNMYQFLSYIKSLVTNSVIYLWPIVWGYMYFLAILMRMLQKYRNIFFYDNDVWNSCKLTTQSCVIVVKELYIMCNVNIGKIYLHN